MKVKKWCSDYSLSPCGFSVIMHLRSQAGLFSSSKYCTLGSGSGARDTGQQEESQEGSEASPPCPVSLPTVHQVAELQGPGLGKAAPRGVHTGSRHCLAVEAKPSRVSGPGPPRTGRVNPEDAMREMRPLGPQVVGGSSVWATGPGCRGPVATPSLTQRDPLKLAESTFPAPCAPSPTLQTALSWLRPRRPTLLPTLSLCGLLGVRKGPRIRSCLVSVFMHRHQHLGSSRARRARVGETTWLTRACRQEPRWDSSAWPCPCVLLHAFGGRDQAEPRDRGLEPSGGTSGSRHPEG